MRAEVAQADAVGQVRCDEGPGRVRHEDLAAVRDGRDPRRPVDVEPDHATRRRTPASPVWMPIRTRIAAPSGHGSAASARWAGDGRRDRRARRAGEDDEERVALGPLLVAAVRREGLAQELAMPLAQLGVALGADAAARAASSPRCR